MTNQNFSVGISGPWWMPTHLTLVHLKFLKPKQFGHCSLQQSCLGPAPPHSSSIETQAGEGISVRDTVKRYSKRQWEPSHGSIVVRVQKDTYTVSKTNKDPQALR